jgi:hypothetical protein
MVQLFVYLSVNYLLIDTRFIADEIIQKCILVLARNFSQLQQLRASSSVAQTSLTSNLDSGSTNNINTNNSSDLFDGIIDLSFLPLKEMIELLKHPSLTVTSEYSVCTFHRVLHVSH